MKKSLLLFLTVIVLIACNANNDKTLAMADVKMEEQEQIMTDSTGSPQFAPPGKAKDYQPVPTMPVDWDKKIVKTATLNASIENFKTFSQTITAKVKALGGYISNEQQTTSETKLESVVVIKVPVAQFDAAVNSLLQNVKQVDGKQIAAEDVTTEYVDSKARLEAKKQMRQRYLELLQKARNMSEILEVQKEINSIQEEIESVTGRLNYLSQSSAMSTIHFTYYQWLEGGGRDTETPGFFAKLFSAFNQGWSWMGDLLVGVVSIWPLLILIVLVVMLFKKRTLVRVK